MTAENPTAHETLRKADLAAIGQLLESQRARTLDLSTQGRKLWIANGNLIVQGIDPFIDTDGVTDVNGTYAFGEVGLESFASRINVPQNTLRDWRDNKTDLFDTVAGYLLRGELNGEPSPYTVPDGRVHTLRLLRADNTQDNEVDGMVRAVLGGNYMALDNLDALFAVLDGMKLAGITADQCKIEADLTESRMAIKVYVESIYAYAPDVFKGYVSPFSGDTVETMPKVFAGFVSSNSEVGRGAWSIAPRIVYQACKNGTNITKDVFDKRHTGEKLDGDGIVKWSQATQKANLDLIKLKTADVVRTFLDADYVKAKLDEMAQAAGVKVKEDPEEIITKVTRHTGHTAQRASVLAMYLQGGQSTAGGVMQAYTAAAQAARSGDTAYSLEGRSVDAMQWVAARSN